MRGAKMNNNTMKHGLLVIFAAVGMLLATGCGYSKDIKEFPEPWQTLDPGKPPEKLPKIEILEQGGGQLSSQET
jgi:hypothetical protein